MTNFACIIISVCLLLNYPVGRLPPSTDLQGIMLISRIVLNLGRRDVISGGRKNG